MYIVYKFGYLKNGTLFFANCRWCSKDHHYVDTCCFCYIQLLSYDIQNNRRLFFIVLMDLPLIFSTSRSFSEGKLFPLKLNHSVLQRKWFQTTLKYVNKQLAFLKYFQELLEKFSAQQMYRKIANISAAYTKNIKKFSGL